MAVEETPEGGGASSVQRPGDSECAFSPSSPLCLPLMGTGPLELSERLFPMGPVLQRHLLVPTATITLPPPLRPTQVLLFVYTLVSSCVCG